jgi:hypothetical protein
MPEVEDALDPDGFLIDRSRPKLSNPDGSFSTESTITVGIDGRYYNIPTIVNGQRVGQEAAIQAARRNLEAFPNYQTLEQALAAAANRSNAIGALRGGEPR